MNIKYPYLQLVVANLIWGGNFVIGRAVSDQLPPITLSFFRWLIALIVVLIIFRKQLPSKEEIKQMPSKDWWYIGSMAISGVIGFNTLLYIALNYTTSINASLVFAATPVVIGILSLIILREKLKKNQVLGIFCTFWGVIYIISKGTLTTLASLSFNRGDIIVILAVLAWGLYSIIVRHTKQLPFFSTFVLSIVMGVVVLLPLFIWEITRPGNVIIWSGFSILSILYVGIVASIVAFILWNSAIIEIGPIKSSVFLNLIPVFAALFAVFFNNEVLARYQLIGGIIVILGVYLSTLNSHNSD